MRVVGEGLDGVGAGVHEVAVKLTHDLGVVDDDLGDEGASLQIAASLTFEQISLGTDDRPAAQPLHQARPGLRLDRGATDRHMSSISYSFRFGWGQGREGEPGGAAGAQTAASAGSRPGSKGRMSNSVRPSTTRSAPIAPTTV